MPLAHFIVTGAPKQTWDDSVTKFLAFGLTKYHRVLHLDSDITLLQHLDELFFLPTPIAMPRAYWSDFKPWPLTSLLMLLEPNTQELEGFKTSIKAGAETDVVTSKKYDMDLLNDRFSGFERNLLHECLHRRFAPGDVAYIRSLARLRRWDWVPTVAGGQPTPRIVRSYPWTAAAQSKRPAFAPRRPGRGSD